MVGGEKKSRAGRLDELSIPVHSAGVRNKKTINEMHKINPSTKRSKANIKIVI